LNFRQAGERYRSFEDWELDELISNLVGALSVCDRDIQDRMVSYFTQADADYGRRVAEGLGIQVDSQAVETAGTA
jgi:catalase